jgi:hypothetical protein
MTEFFRNRKQTKMNRRKVDPAGERARGLLQCVQCLERVLGSDINTLATAPTEDHLIASLSSLVYGGRVNKELAKTQARLERAERA